MKLIGKKCKGFKFEPKHRCSHVEGMNNYDGVVGVIQKGELDNLIKIEFPDGETWHYPKDEAFEHLVKTCKLD